MARRRRSFERLELLGQAEPDHRNGSVPGVHWSNRAGDADEAGPVQRDGDSSVDRSHKQELITSLHQTLMGAELVVVTRQAGMTVAEVTSLRRQMREAGAGFKVAKNRLARRALEGTKFTGLASMLKGPTAIAYSKDPVAAAKVANAYAEDNSKLTIVGGAMGEQLLDPQGIKALAKLPSIDGLRARLVGMLQTPATRVATILQAPAAQLARVLSAYAKKESAAS